MTERWVYDLTDLDDARASVGNDWDEVRGLLGGKGANLADMASMGIPVPPGFTITTRACNAYVAAEGEPPEGMWDEVTAAMRRIEAATGKTYGGSDNPLLVAVRSGAKFSMPGMMDTVLNVGMNDEVVEAMVARTGDERFVLDSYRRLIQMFGTVVLGVDGEVFEDILQAQRRAAGVATDADLDAADLRIVVDRFRDAVARRADRPFPTDPEEQLRLAIDAVFDSWDTKRANDYRAAAGIPHDLGTAVNVVSMVFGNTGANSGTGVAMSRNGTTGERSLEGDFLVNAQGEDVVAGIRATQPISELASALPDAAEQFTQIAQQLEDHYRDMQDLEFTVEDGRLWLLQTRTGKRTAQAAVRIAVEMAEEGAITREEAVLRVSPEQVEFFLHPQLAGIDQLTPIAYGLNVSPGAAVGQVAFDPDLAQRWGEDGRAVVLVRPETKPDDVHGMLASVGILTSSGGRTSHAALVARQFGRPAVTGADRVQIDLRARTLTVGSVVIAEGEWISLDGTTGAVYDGRVDTVDPDLDNEWLSKLLDWADEFRRLGVRANADDPVEAERARSYGASGIGLCRTEHMFFAADRLPIVQRMITAPSPIERREAIDELLPMQRGDFDGLFRAMDGLPVIIRLLDPPLHEFLPSWDELQRQIADLQIKMAKAPDLSSLESVLNEYAEAKDWLSRVEALRESNPMLGLRGVRLGNKMPEITRMQVRAVLEAALDVKADGLTPVPEIMVPLVGHRNELARQRAIIEEVAEAVFSERGDEIDLMVGTMIEVPRAALTAGEVAEEADFFSFGTNDLTQTTFAISRDDGEGAFLLGYLADGTLPHNPFASIDEDSVGRLMSIAVEEGKRTKPTLETGVCGEHGGDPASIRFCHDLGLDYVSCSAYRIPVARLAAAQAALGDR